MGIMTERYASLVSKILSVTLGILDDGTSADLGWQGVKGRDDNYKAKHDSLTLLRFLKIFL